MNDTETTALYSARKEERKMLREQGLHKINEFMFMKNEFARLDKQLQLEKEQK